MGAALAELEAKLKANKDITLAETRILDACKSKAIRGFVYGALGGWGLAFAAMWKSRGLLRTNLSGGIAMFSGLWQFGRSLDSCVEDVLAQEGTRMQVELANILVDKYQGDPWTIRLISKHFYTERVYDDSTSDQPKLRWRYRSYFSDDVVQGQKTRDNDDRDGYTNTHNNSLEDSCSAIHSDSTPRKAALISRRAPCQVNAGLDTITDPLDDIVDRMGTLEEVDRTSNSNMPAKVHNRSHKRSHRRRQQRHREASLEPVHE